MKSLKMILKPFVRFVSLFVKRCIVFESVPDFSDNTRCVYDELKNRGYDKKYFFIWQTSYDKISVYENKTEWVIYHPHTFKQLLMSISFKFKRKCSIYGNRIFDNGKNSEIVFFLNHGGPFKATKGYYSMPKYVDYVLSLSEYLAPIAAYQGDVPIEKMFALGFPRNDCLINPSADIDLKKVLKTECNKVIVWYPTYRQNKFNNMHVSEKTLPVVSDKETVIELNNHAKGLGILIIIKPHFGQDLSYFNFSGLSNIKRIDDSFFTENNMTAYEFVGACDALLTDYSSIYYDYTLCDKPLGVIWADIDEYKESPGFAVDLDIVLKGAEKLYNLNDLKCFIEEVAAGVDCLMSTRRNVRDNIVQFVDGKSTERVTNFIVEKTQL